jgi:hypothetical protein
MKTKNFIFICMASCVLSASAQTETKVDSYQATETKNHFSISLGTGVGFMTAKSNLSPYGVHYRDKYKSGYTVDAKINYNIHYDWVLGVKYNYFSAHSNYKLVSSQLISDDMDISYIAPQLGVIECFNKKWLLEVTFGVGYLSYGSEGFMDDTPQKRTANMVGYNIDATISYKFTKNFAIGITYAGLGNFHSSKMKVGEGDNRQTIHLDNKNRLRVNRLDLQLVLRYVLK